MRASMKYQNLSLALFFSLLGAEYSHALCSAAPTGSTQDTAILMMASGSTAGIGPVASVSSTNEGVFVYDSANDVLKYCNGTSWVQLSSNSMTGSGATNHIPYWSSSSNLTYDNAQLYWDATNNRLGIGTNAPGDGIEVSGSAVLVSGTSDFGMRIYRTRGSNILSGDRLGYLIFGGNTTASTYNNAAAVTGYAEQDFGGSQAGTNIRFETSGLGSTTRSERMRVSADGNLGISTTAPNARLSIGNNIATGYLDNYSEYQMLLYDTGTAATSYGLGIKGSTMVFNSGAGAFSFDRGGGANTITMDTSGRVGIGTTAPNAKLHVYEATVVGGSVGNSNTLTQFDGSTGNNSYLRTVLYRHTAGSGWGGVATRLQSGVDNTNMGYIDFNPGSGSQGIALGNGSSEYVRMDSSGNVGIGTTNPGAKLHVYGGQIRIDNSNGQYARIEHSNSGTIVWSVGTQGNASDYWISRHSGSGNFFMPNGYASFGGATAPVGRIQAEGDTANGTVWNNAALILKDSGTYGRTWSVGSRAASGLVIGDETAATIRMNIGATGVATFYGTSTCTIANGSGATNCTSDGRLKDRIKPISGALEKLMLTKGVTFHWKDKSKNQREYLGLIAQDVEKVFPQAVQEISDTTLGSAKTLDYAVLVAPIIEAMRELKADNDNLRIQLKAANDNLEHRLDAVERALKSAR